MHLEKSADSHTTDFLRKCVDHGLIPQNRIKSYSLLRYLGHTLDCTLSTVPLKNISLGQNAISDHYAMKFDIVVPNKLKVLSLVHPEFYHSRYLRNINVNVFSADFDEVIKTENITSSQALFELFDKLLNKHAPLQKRLKKVRGKSFKYSHVIATAKRCRPQLERQFNKSQRTIHKQLLAKQRELVRRMVKSESFTL